ncbi:BTAD domain-containing putative transcriptional regulator [Amycolatopsis sp. NPDC051102]|uniref:AfsR/SARP family transcriptional regulator n=1 Tax=Amycolatopsis sp. NPDC051102 TaxID=3155163 RepID=UPI00342B1EBE
MRINVLGTLECWAGDRRIHLGGPVPERVLVSLLLEAGQVLSVSRLVEAVWEETPPATATHQVRKAVARLRQLIPGGAGLIVTDGPGYRAVVAAGCLDLGDFSASLDQAREATAERRLDDALTHLQSALALRRGPVLAGSGGAVIRSADVALQERHLAALEQMIDLRLARGESSTLIGDLREHVAAHPLREVLRGQLMLALYRSGRQAEAIEEYGRVRTLLADELGIDPGAHLAELYGRMLRNAPDLAAPEPVAAAEPGPAAGHGPRDRAPVCTLPYDLADFTGRRRELEALCHYADNTVGRGTRIIGIDGMGGAGKTSLAVRACYQLADRFPDGQLYIDLGGYATNEHPLTAQAVAEALLRMLGVPTDHLADDVGARAALWRTTVTGRKLLVLLDNAADLAQVRPLLPSSPGCMVLITSRTRLIDLDGAYWLSVGTMTAEDGAALADSVLSKQRTSAEPQAVAALIELCGHLPLAMRIALSRLANRPRWSIGYLVDRMSDESRRLDELRSGDRGVELTLKMSYEGLAPAQRAAFRLLGLHPGRDIDVHSAAAVLGTAPDEAETMLEVLLDMQMMQQHELGYYTFHDLVRSFVHQLDRLDDTGPRSGETRAALRRLFDYLGRVTDRVCDILFPGRAHLPFEAPESTSVLPPLPDPEAARAWLVREHATLQAAIMLAHARGLDGHVAHLARNVVFQLDASGQFAEFLEMTKLAVDSSRRLGHRPLLRISLSNLAVVHWKLGRFEESIAAASEALELAGELGDQRGFAKDTGMLGLLMCTIGRFEEALALLERSVALKRDLGAGRAEAESLVNLSTLYEQWGRYPEAADAARRAVMLNRELGIREHEMIALTDLSLACLGLGADEEASEHLAGARVLAEESASAGDVAMVFALSALTCQRLGHPEPAVRFAERALDLGDTYRTPVRQAVINNLLGGLHRTRQEHATALALHESAYSISADIGYRVEEARALHGMGLAHAALGDPAAGDEHLRRAEALFATLGVPTRPRD